MNIQQMIFAIISILFYIIVSFRSGKSITDGLKGDNGKWDPPEVIIFFTITLFVVAVMADIFVNLHASPLVWGSIDFIIVGTLGYKAHKNVQDKKPN